MNAAIAAVPGANTSSTPTAHTIGTSPADDSPHVLKRLAPHPTFPPTTLPGQSSRAIRTVGGGGAVIHVSGKGGKERSVPVEAALVTVIEAYLDSRAVRLPETVKRHGEAGITGLARWSTRSPLFIGRDGQRITRGTLQSRIKRAFKLAGSDAQPVPGALVHGLRHTYATELAGSDVSVYTLMKLLGHESMTTSQRYVTAAGTETRSAAAQNPIYGMIRPI